MKLDREELAWAAGLFDGEGTVGCTALHKGAAKTRVALRIGQKTPEVLYRFRAAVGNLGSIHGPYTDKRRPGSVIYEYSAGGFEKVQAIMASLWAFLSGPKREQFKRAVLELKVARPYIRPWSPGHPRPAGV